MVLLALTTACAAHTVRDKVRVGALTVGELALEVDKQERVVYAADVPGYDKAAHDKVGVAVVKMLQAARAYEAAAREWPKGGALPETVDQAAKAINAALDELVLAVPAIDGVRVPIYKAIAAVRAAIATQGAALGGDLHVSQASLPSGGLLEFVALFNIFAQLIQSGKMTFDRLRSIAKQEGASDEQLAELDLRLSDAIAARERDSQE